MQHPFPRPSRQKTAPRGAKSLLGRLGLFLGIFLLSFAVVATLPSKAHAAPAGEGVFDCLAGNLDWGCKVLSFLFENKELYLNKNGVAVPDKPGPVETALHKMMQFFSNAILIVASLKLLFELIQMVAETAHTGHIGGKDTNQLWAPIRLVVAIGLLVPLSSGLNSAQYIILQVAKWGSGMASQAWKVFAVGLTEKQKLAAPVPAQIYDLGANTFKSFTCRAMVNYYAKHMTYQVKEIVAPLQQFEGPNNKIVFANRIHNNVCGEVIFRVPQLQPGSRQDEITSAKLTQWNFDTYNTYFKELGLLANKWAPYFLPEKKADFTPDMSAKAIKEIEDTIQRYQTEVNNYYESSAVQNLGQNELKKITAEIEKGAKEHGWTAAGSWFLAITRAQGAIINGGLNIPQAAHANMQVLKNYPAAVPYQEFLDWYGSTERRQDETPLPVNYGVGAERVKINNDAQSTWAKIASMTGRQVIDFVLGILDGLGTDIGLWTADKSKAFGDLGGSTNPFGEIAALGQKHIRLGLDYIGTAISINLAGAVVGTLGSFLGASAASGLSVAMFFIGSMFLGFAVLFLLAGTLLGFIIPLLPFMRFFFAIVTWLGTFVEGMLCAPFIALAHLTPKGEGFSGQNARGAYFLIFQIFLRPILSLFGMIVSILVFYVCAKFLNSIYYEAVGAVGIFEGGLQFVTKVIFTIFYVGMIYILANSSFKLMEQIPKNALRWMGAQAHEDTHEEQAHGFFLSAVAPAMGGQAISRYAGMGPQGIQAAGSKIMGGITGEKSRIEAETTRIDNARTSREDRDAQMGAYRSMNSTLNSINSRLGGGDDLNGTSPASVNPNAAPDPDSGGGGEAASQPRSEEAASQPRSGEVNRSEVADIRNEQQTQGARLSNVGHRQTGIDNSALAPADVHERNYSAFQDRAKNARDNKPKPTKRT